MDFADGPERAAFRSKIRTFWFHPVLRARQYTVADGTSEIQRNIIGEHVLGLPKG